ncbi:hypothetical protein EJ02DRAFT_424605 [Clathrospora elynae]|uniref:Uncharacterized protein n=1 Tax=Clathrospora elynae TaxID=706981 RepID=A0A6A5SJB5_9PLEO|nr:hypothetical protein EJ02DRAFT_424605 [Clathrospora elynae]
MLAAVVQWTIGKQLDGGTDMVTDANKRMNAIFQSIKRRPGGVLAMLNDRLKVEEKIKEKYRQIVLKVVGSIDFENGIKFPSEPKLHNCRLIWKETMDHLRVAVEIENKLIDHLPINESAGRLTRAGEDIASGRTREDELEDCIKYILNHLKSPYSVQTLMGGLCKSPNV